LQQRIKGAEQENNHPFVETREEIKQMLNQEAASHAS
jgi:hypothetical protein